MDQLDKNRMRNELVPIHVITNQNLLFASCCLTLREQRLNSFDITIGFEWDLQCQSLISWKTRHAVNSREFGSIPTHSSFEQVSEWKAAMGFVYHQDGQSSGGFQPPIHLGDVLRVTETQIENCIPVPKISEHIVQCDQWCWITLDHTTE